MVLGGLFYIRINAPIILLVSSVEPLPEVNQVRRDETFRIQLRSSLAVLPMPLSLAKRVDVFQAGQHELKKADTPVPTGLTDAKEDQIIVQPLLPHRFQRPLTIPNESLDCILRTIVVPCDAIVPSSTWAVTGDFCMTPGTAGR